MLFFIYTQISSVNAAERAKLLTEKIKRLYRDNRYNPDSLRINTSEDEADIVYNDIGLLAVTGIDALWQKQTRVIVFPYLPGSNSDAFKGVSVFLGVLVSFGSSSAISNIVAGLVITYMCPYKIGDRVKIGDVTGDVLEEQCCLRAFAALRMKTLLFRTRLCCQLIPLITPPMQVQWV